MIEGTRLAANAAAGERRSKYVAARGIWWALLKLLRARAITMPWRRVYVLAEHLADPILWRHEMIHIEQIERDGAVRFTVQYLAWLIRYGYWNNPYEVEAYARESEPVPPLPPTWEA